MLKRTLRFALVCLTLAGAAGWTRAAQNPFLGSWELTIPGGRAGWLGVEQNGGGLKASILWGGGSVLPVASAELKDGQLVLTRHHTVQVKEPGALKPANKTITETITAKLTGAALELVTVKPRASGQGEERAEFSGRRSPPLPPAPELSRVKFGPPIPLFNGKDLTGWRLVDPGSVNGWSARDGLLVNNPVQEEGKPRKSYGNLRTDREFEDFHLSLEVRVGEKQNSGVYLRGIYEIQVADTYGQPVDAHNMGALYSRITPSRSAEKPPGEWQKLDLTLVARHVTVVLNGHTIINNQPAAGCTGGALWSDTSRPGPIYLQGDHTGIEYRHLVLRPVIP